MQEIRSSNPPVVTVICDSNKYRARHHRRITYSGLSFDKKSYYGGGSLDLEDT